MTGWISQGQVSSKTEGGNQRRYILLSLAALRLPRMIMDTTVNSIELFIWTTVLIM